MPVTPRSARTSEEAASSPTKPPSEAATVESWSNWVSGGSSSSGTRTHSGKVQSSKSGEKLTPITRCLGMMRGRCHSTQRRVWGSYPWRMELSMIRAPEPAQPSRWRQVSPSAEQAM